MLLLTALLLAARPASAASPTVTTLSEQEQEAFFASAFSAFDSAQTEVAQDEPASCRCVTPACCGRARGTTLTPAQTSGVGLLEERSGLDGDTPGCLRAGNVCCDLADIENTTQCQQDAGSKNGTEHPSGEDRCGTRGSIASHGDVVSPGQFPWLVTVWERGGKYLLGAGALIHPRLVITAAHIVEDEPVDSLLVRLGNGSAGLAVAEAALHSDWAGRARYHDLAVLRLAAPAELGPHVLPACLGPATLDPGAPFRLSGCQTVQIVNEELPTSLRASNVRLLSRSQCEAGLKATGKLPQTFGLHYSFTCAAARVGSGSACRTESGAPLTCADPGRPGRTVLVGLLSWNAGCRAVRGWPDVYTRLADVDSFCWLERTVTRMLGEEWPHFGERSACELGRPERATE